MISIGIRRVIKIATNDYRMGTAGDMTFDNIYHEHTNYWSVHSICEFFNRLNLLVVKIEHVNTHGGSINYNMGSSTNDPSGVLHNHTSNMTLPTNTDNSNSVQNPISIPYQNMLYFIRI